MHRREFIVTAASALAGGGWSCASGRLRPRAGSEPPLDAAAFHAARLFAETRFGRIAYVQRGTGRAALFLHGLPLNGFQWRGAIERLSGDRRCIAPDLMGLGYSEIPEHQGVGPDDQVAMLGAFLESVGVSSLDLVASDSGGAVAQLFVARHPERVRTLLLTNCDVHEDSPPPALKPVIEASRAGRFADEVLAPQLADKARAHLPGGLGGCCYTQPGGLTGEAIEVYLRPLVRSPLRKAQFHAYCVALERNVLVPIEPALRRCRTPLRVVWGTGDTIFDPSGPDWLHSTFPESRGVRRVEGANLFFPEELPDLIADEARRLWASEHLSISRGTYRP